MWSTADPCGGAHGLEDDPDIDALYSEGLGRDGHTDHVHHPELQGIGRRTGRATMACCPHCRSERIAPSHLGRRLGSTIGTLAGAATATARVAGGAQLGAELGAVVGTSAGPAGITLGAIGGAMLGAMVGAAAGCAIGAALGEAIDAKILHNHHCIDCGRGFSLDTP